MNQFTHGVIKHRRIILIIFTVLAILSAVMATTVSINYNMVDYLPKKAPSTMAVRIIEDEFVGDMPNARVMINDVSILEALEYKERISNIDGITSVSWLDDIIGLDSLQTLPLEFQDKAIIESYYKEGSALLTMEIESGKEQSTVA